MFSFFFPWERISLLHCTQLKSKALREQHILKNCDNRPQYLNYHLQCWAIKIAMYFYFSCVWVKRAPSRGILRLPKWMQIFIHAGYISTTHQRRRISSLIPFCAPWVFWVFFRYLLITQYLSITQHSYQHRCSHAAVLVNILVQTDNSFAPGSQGNRWDPGINAV